MIRLKRIESVFKREAEASFFVFSKQFKKITGMSPSQYQKMVRSSKKDPLYEQRELWFSLQNRRTRKMKKDIFVTLVAAGWMFAHALASNLCSEATNISFFIFRVLIVVAEVNSTAVSIKIFEEFYRTSHLDDLLTLQTLLILLLWRLPCLRQSESYFHKSSGYTPCCFISEIASITDFLSSL